MATDAPAAWRGSGSRRARASTKAPSRAAIIAKLVEIEDSYTLIPEDQPERLARELREFVEV